VKRHVSYRLLPLVIHDNKNVSIAIRTIFCYVFHVLVLRPSTESIGFFLLSAISLLFIPFFISY
jgi:hypothetical protein